MKIFLKSSLIDKKTSVLLQNQKNNVIDIDSPDMYSESENSDYMNDHSKL